MISYGTPISRPEMFGVLIEPPPPNLFEIIVSWAGWDSLLDAWSIAWRVSLGITLAKFFMGI